MKKRYEVYMVIDIDHGVYSNPKNWDWPNVMDMNSDDIIGVTTNSVADDYNPGFN